MKITLQQIRDNSPCREGWTKLLKSLDNPTDMTTTVSIGQIAHSNGPNDALWCLRCAEFDRRDILRAIMPAVRRASTHATDISVHDCIKAIDGWIAGTVTDTELRTTAARVARTAYAARAAAAYAARVARAADAAADAYAAAYAAARAEREKQIDDICAVFP